MNADDLETDGETFAEGARRERREARARLLADAPTGADLRFARKACGLRGIDLAARLDVTPETVSRWETGALPTTRLTCLALVALLLLKENDESSRGCAKSFAQSLTE